MYFDKIINTQYGAVAQLVERLTENVFCKKHRQQSFSKINVLQVRLLSAPLKGTNSNITSI